MTEKESKWIKFCPSLELPKERVSIAYATHDERGYRFAYGYFQFHNGTCSSFWKDGNEQPKAVKVDDIKYWMPVPSLDSMQEEPVSEDLEDAASRYAKEEYSRKNPSTLPDRCLGCYAPIMYAFRNGANWQKEQLMKDAVEAQCFGFQGAALFSFRLPSDKYFVGSEVKVIVIKED